MDLAARQKKTVLLAQDGFALGWKTGFEPATSGTTIQHSNQLSYIHRLGLQIYKKILIHRSYFSASEGSSGGSFLAS